MIGWLFTSCDFSIRGILCIILFACLLLYFDFIYKCIILYHFSVKRLGSNPGRFANATLVRLSEYLSAGYKKGVRPVKDWRDSTMVAIDLMVYSILNVVSRTIAIQKSKPWWKKWYFIVFHIQSFSIVAQRKCTNKELYCF